MTSKVKLFHSAMTGIPTLSGTAGALITLLDAILVNGYGSTNVATLIVTDGIATATYASGHPFSPDTVALFSGATPSGLNGDNRILTTSANSVTFDATGIANGTATGTITSKVAAAGWEKAFSGTNVAVYRSLAVDSTRCYLRVDDTGTTNARVRAYESMTDVSTGVGPTPLDGQVSGGLHWPKSNAAGASVRPWQLVADSRGFYLALSPAGGHRYTLMYAGDISSLKSGDAYGFLLTGNQVESMGNSSLTPDGCVGFSHRNVRGGAYIVRSYMAVGQSTPVQRLGAHHNGTTADVYAGDVGYSFGTYPNGSNNGLLTGALELHAQGIRGTLPGLLHPVQFCGSSFENGVVIDGTDDLAGHRLRAITTCPPLGTVIGTVFIDITGPWER